MPKTENVDSLRPVYGAASMNDDTHAHLWVQGAAQIMPRLTDLVMHNRKVFRVLHTDVFANPDQERLGEILRKNQSDKSGTHNYHVVYSYIFRQLGDRPIKTLEVGIGTNNQDLVSSMGWNGRPGASLYAFREFLPKAQVYGADIDRGILMTGDRIKTSYVDQMNMNTFKDMNDNFGNVKFDLIIDDGLHSIGANLNTLVYALDQVADGGWIVIEDIALNQHDYWRPMDAILQTMPQYDAFMVKCKQSCMYVVHKLSPTG